MIRQDQVPHWVIIGLTMLALFMVAMVKAGRAADLDGRYKDSPLRSWFDSLQNQHHESCCSSADGVTITDVDWDTEGEHYRVRLGGQWIVVPDHAVINTPNRYGPAVVWPMPFNDANGKPTIRCFMPSSMS